MINIEWEIMRGCANKLLKDGMSKEINFWKKICLERRKYIKNYIASERLSNQRLKQDHELSRM